MDYSGYAKKYYLYFNELNQKTYCQLFCHLSYLFGLSCENKEAMYPKRLLLGTLSGFAQYPEQTAQRLTLNPVQSVKLRMSLSARPLWHRLPLQIHYMT